jgi:hypothetical protein
MRELELSFLIPFFSLFPDAPAAAAVANKSLPLKDARTAEKAGS